MKLIQIFRKCNKRLDIGRSIDLDDVCFCMYMVMPFLEFWMFGNEVLSKLLVFTSTINIQMIKFEICQEVNKLQKDCICTGLSLIFILPYFPYSLHFMSLRASINLIRQLRAKDVDDTNVRYQNYMLTPYRPIETKNQFT